MSYDITARELNLLNNKVLNQSYENILDEILKEAAFNGQSFYKTEALQLSRALTYHYSDMVVKASIKRIDKSTFLINPLHKSIK